MDCPFYLVLLTLQNSSRKIWQEIYELDAREAGANFDPASIPSIWEHCHELTLERRSQLLTMWVVANSLEGAPKIVGRWKRS